MVASPRVFGHPLWVGVKRRVAKKHINRHGRNMLQRLLKLAETSSSGNNLVYACTGLNCKVTRVEPSYRRVGNGRVLWDLDFETDKGGCSLYHCGVDAPISYEEALAHRDRVVQRWTGNDYYGFAERYSKITINPDGTFEWAPEELKIDGF